MLIVMKNEATQIIHNDQIWLNVSDLVPIFVEILQFVPMTQCRLGILWDNVLSYSSITVKPVCNDHIYPKIYHLWLIQ